MATELLMKFSAFLGAWWWLMITVIVAGWLIFRGYVGTPAGRLWWDSAKLKLPLFGPVIATRLYAQFAHSLGNLVVNGWSPSRRNSVAIPVRSAWVRTAWVSKWFEGKGFFIPPAPSSR